MLKSIKNMYYHEKVKTSPEEVERKRQYAREYMGKKRELAKIINK